MGFEQRKEVSSDCVLTSTQLPKTYTAIMFIHSVVLAVDR